MAKELAEDRGSTQPAADGISRGNIFISCVFSAVILLIGVVHLFWKKLDPTFLGLVAIAAVPWLAAFIKKLELPGGWKFEFQELKKQFQEVRGTAQSADLKAETATELAQAKAPTASRGLQTSDDQARLRGELEELAKEYNRVRASQLAGSRRTSNMTAVVSKMIAAAGTSTELKAEELLNDKDNGKRLIAYAAIYARPDCKYLQQLTSALTKVETTPFGQYWAIQALRKVIGKCDPNSIEKQTIVELRRFLQEELSPSEDRYVELARILKEL